MKKAAIIIIALVLLAGLNSCGVSNALILNQNLNSTQVHLSSNNYKVVGKVSGKSEVSYVLVFGGINKRQLYENAYSEMVKSADLIGSKALVNVVTEEHVGGVPPFYYTRTITVSANVVQFVR